MSDSLIETNQKTEFFKLTIAQMCAMSDKDDKSTAMSIVCILAAYLNSHGAHDTVLKRIDDDQVKLFATFIPDVTYGLDPFMIQAKNTEIKMGVTDEMGPVDWVNTDAQSDGFYKELDRLIQLQKDREADLRE